MTEYIAFPKLGWELSISDTLAEFGLFGLDFSIKWYMVLIVFGFLLAFIYAYARIKTFELDPDRMFDVVFASTVIGLVGARLFYVLFAPAEIQELYFAEPVQILLMWDGNFNLFGGLLFAFLGGILVCRWRKVDTWRMFDLASVCLLIGQAVICWGDFFHQNAFGTNTDLPWGMTGSEIIKGTIGGYDAKLPVHPVFLYEFLWCVLGVVLLHIISQKWYKKKGLLFPLYLIWYGVGSFCFEGLRVGGLNVGTMKASRLFAVLMVIAGVVILLARRAKAQSTAKDLFKEESSVYSSLLDDEDDEDAIKENADENTDAVVCVGEEE